MLTRQHFALQSFLAQGFIKNSQNFTDQSENMQNKKKTMMTSQQEQRERANPKTATEGAASLKPSGQTGTELDEGT